MTSSNRPQWRLPAGVTRGLWEYAHSPQVATNYDAYFAYNRLFQFDEQVLVRQFEQSGVPLGGLVGDLGCGTGRALMPLARRGYRGLAIDLSQEMLQIVRDKAEQEELPIGCVRANLVELDGIADESLDAALCLFSTLGMIRGRLHRRRALQHAQRLLRPGAPLVLHVHNLWYNLHDPGGPWWILKSFLNQSLFRDVEVGDKFFAYRGVPNMFLHVFRRGEVIGDLRAAGLRVREVIPLDHRRYRALRWPWFAGRLRANGWVVTAVK